MHRRQSNKQSIIITTPTAVRDGQTVCRQQTRAPAVVSLTSRSNWGAHQPRYLCSRLPLTVDAKAVPTATNKKLRALKERTKQARREQRERKEHRHSTTNRRV
eukprot:scaffold34612_cov165-Amphora_coffeaeformis.AAC.16